MITFQYYPNEVKSNKPLGDISLNKFLGKIKHPNPETIELYNAIELATKNKDEEARGRLKSKLYYFTPAVYVNQARRYNQIMHWTGLMPLDFDKINFADEFRDYLISEYPFIIASWLSSSRYGVRALARIPVVHSVDDYKALYYGMRDTIGGYNGFDMAPQNCVLPLFLSYDADMKYNLDAELFTTIGVNMKDIKYSIPQDYRPVQQSEGKTKFIEKGLITAINKIHDNGHPQLRAVAVALGGYVGAGYIDEISAHQMICGIIRSNAYLSKKPSVYEKTALDMIRFGINTPLYID